MPWICVLRSRATGESICGDMERMVDKKTKLIEISLVAINNGFQHEQKRFAILLTLMAHMSMHSLRFSFSQCRFVCRPKLLHCRNTRRFRRAPGRFFCV